MRQPSGKIIKGSQDCKIINLDSQGRMINDEMVGLDRPCQKLRT